jgi:hypothetical protein
MMIKVKTIKELYNKVHAGEVDESQIKMRIDNNYVSFFYQEKEFVIEEANGIFDIQILYKLLFPKADIKWV